MKYHFFFPPQQGPLVNITEEKLQLEPIGLVFVCFFAVVLVAQARTSLELDSPSPDFIFFENLLGWAPSGPMCILGVCGV